MTELGALLRILRLTTMRPVRSSHGGVKRATNGSVSWVVMGPMSQNALGRAAGIDPAYVNRLERGGKPHVVSRPIVERLADALGLAELERARLLVAAGYWPFDDAGAERVMLAVATALAVMRGDYRRCAPKACPGRDDRLAEAR